MQFVALPDAARKRRLPALFLAFAAITTVAAIAAITAPAANAQANLVFTGGGTGVGPGTPLVLTLTAPVSYTITTATPAGNGPRFIFQGVGDVIGGPPLNLTGTIAYSINGGASRTLNILETGSATGNAATSDFLIYNSSPSPQGFNTNDIVTVLSGSLTTTTNVPGRPSNGAFTTFVANGGNIRISGNGVAVTAAPEPGSIAFLVPALLGGATFLRRRKQHGGR